MNTSLIVSAVFMLGCSAGIAAPIANLPAAGSGDVLAWLAKPGAATDACSSFFSHARRIPGRPVDCAFPAITERSIETELALRRGGPFDCRTHCRYRTLLGIPEPASFLLIGIGLACMGLIRPAETRVRDAQKLDP